MSLLPGTFPIVGRSVRHRSNTIRRYLPLSTIIICLLFFLLFNLEDISPYITKDLSSITYRPPTDHGPEVRPPTANRLASPNFQSHEQSQSHASRLSPRFVIPPSEYAAPQEDPIEFMPFMAYDPVPPKEEGMVVPDIVHYIWLDVNDSLHLTFSQYLAMRSVIDRQQPSKLYIHCNHEPKGVWWQKIKHHFTVNHLDGITPTIYGKTVIETTHVTDILRILILQEMGGIYLDIDIFVVRSLRELMYAPYTMGQGWVGLFWASIMISIPHAPFLQRFKEAYKDFNPNAWWETSSEKPGEIGRMYPDEVQVVRNTGFFVPAGHEQWIFDEEPEVEYDFFETGQYTYHGWNHVAGWRSLESINPRDVMERNTSFNRMVRALVTSEDVRLWESLTDEEKDKYHDLTHA